MEAQKVNPNIRTELIEVPTTNIASKEFSLGQLPNIRQAKRIIKVETFPVGQVSIAPSGAPVVNNGVFIKSSLRLINSANVEYRHISLNSLSKTVNGSEIAEINCAAIDPEKSKIVVATNAGLAANEVFLLQITYELGQ